MRRVFLIYVFILIFVISSSCKENTSIQNPDNLPTSSSKPYEKSPSEIEKHLEIRVYKAQVSKDWISFWGTSNLSDGTKLQTQLFEDEKPLDWWPVDKYVKVHDGQWQILVPLGENGAPEKLLIGPSYLLKAWDSENPSIEANFLFDLVGPPPAS